MSRRITKRIVLLGGIIFFLAGLVRVATGEIGGFPLLALAGLCLASRFILAIKEGKPGRTSSPVSSEKVVKGINFRLKKCEEGEKLKKEAKKEKRTGEKTVKWILHKRHCCLCRNGDKKNT